jgi:hypothetical protein
MDLLCSRKTRYFNQHERSNKTEWQQWQLYWLVKKRQCNTKKWQCQKKAMENQGDATPPTHINKNKQLEWVKEQRK